MSCGVPVIGTNIGGIPEVVIDGETGFLCEVGQIDRIVEKALELVSDQEGELAREVNHYYGEKPKIGRAHV